MSPRCSSKVAYGFKSPSFLDSWCLVACIRQTDVSSIKALNGTRSGTSIVSVGGFSPLTTSFVVDVDALFVLLICSLQAIHFCYADF